jgi:hypothetical protein
VSERPAIVMREREHLVRAIKDGLRKIEEHDRKIEEHETKRDEREVEVGAALKALKAQKPNGIKWEQYLEECGIDVHRSRADQLIRIADGRTTVEEERADTAERTAKSRAELPLRSGENAGDLEASAEAMKAKFAALDTEPERESAPLARPNEGNGAKPATDVVAACVAEVKSIVGAAMAELAQQEERLGLLNQVEGAILRMKASLTKPDNPSRWRERSWPLTEPN